MNRQATESGSLGESVVALLGAALLLDAAMETWWSGSAVRWWAVGAVAVYVVVTAATLYLRIGWRGRLTVALVAVLGLLAITAWRPGGLTDGLRVFRQPTARVLAATTAAALIAGSVTVVQASAVPVTIRLVATLVTVYGLAAFALGAWHATAYSALFAGDSLWLAAPRWVQGAVVGGLVALPLALLINLFGGLRRERRTWRLEQIVASALVIVMVVSGFTNAAGHTQGTVHLDLAAADGRSPVIPAAQSVDIGPPDDQSVADAVALVKKVSQAPIASRFDVDRKAADIGNDPAAAFAFVHDNVRLEIYSGVLRGARGALAGGAANAWDQSLLLAAMLRHQGREVRFARAHLTPAAASAVAARMFADAARPPVTEMPATEVPNSIRDRSRAVLKRIHATWQAAHADVLAALERAGIAFDEASPVSEVTLAAEAADHVWVEYRDGDRWLPLDPVAAGRAGESAAPATETWAEVPDAFYHRVTIRVKVEERRGQELESKDVLTYSATAAALHGASIVLAYRINKALAGGWRATPTLYVDGHAYDGLSLGEMGVQPAATTPNAIVGDASREVSGVGEVAQLFAGPAPTPTRSALTAIWLEVEFADATKHAETVRRDLLDRIGVVARADGHVASASLTAIPVIDGTPVPFAGIYACAFTAGRLDEASPLLQLSSNIGAVIAAAELQAAARQSQGLATADEVGRMRQVSQSLPATLGTIAATAHVLSQRISTRIAQREDARPIFYEVTPRLAIASLELSASPDARSATPRFGLDLRRNMMRAVARGTNSREVVRANVARGVLDAVIEDTIAGQFAAAVDPRPASTIAILTQAGTQGLALTATRSALPIRALPLPEEARLRMQAAVSNSLAVVTPVQPVLLGKAARAAWWQVDLSSGDVLGVIDNGLHGAQFPEDGVVIYLPLEGGPVAAEWAAERYGTWLGPLIVGAILAAALTFALSK